VLHDPLHIAFSRHVKYSRVGRRAAAPPHVALRAGQPQQWIELGVQIDEAPGRDRAGRIDQARRRPVARRARLNGHRAAVPHGQIAGAGRHAGAVDDGGAGYEQVPGPVSVGALTAQTRA
jgi:hypothetical protein